MVNPWKSAAIGACALLAAQAANARDLTIAGWGGNYQDAQRAAYFQPFADSKGIAFTETTYLGGLAEVKTMADSGNATWDLVIAEGADLQVGCDEGLFEELDWDSIPAQNQLVPEAIQPCGAGNVVIGVGLAYNPEALDEMPQNWQDFFNTEKWPGKRGMRTGPKYNLEFALIADGVSPDQVYEVLATPEGVDRAFAKLDTIKQDIQFWDAGAQPVEWLVAGNVVMTISYNARISAAQQEGRPFVFVWTNPLYSIDAWAIPANAPNKDLAMDFIRFASTAEPQANFSKLMPYGPTNVEVPAMLPPEVLDNLPAGENISDGFFFSDPFWMDNNDALSERWNNWVTQ